MAKEKQLGREGHLGLDEWELIVLLRLSDVCPSKVGSVVAAVQALASASQVCRDLAVATNFVWTHLASRLPDSWGQHTPLIQRAISTPTNLKLDELKQVARALGVLIGGNKAELIHRIFKTFKLSQPTQIPCSVIKAYHEDQQAVLVQEQQRVKSAMVV